MSGCVAWFTGLSGAGKSIIASRAAQILGERGRKVLVLDGDIVRADPDRRLGFSPEDIRENNRRIARQCVEDLHEYDVILVPIISPFRDSRAGARKELGEGFVEVYVQASLDEVRRRDPKGLYRKVSRGELAGFIGIAEEVPYEAPEAPELVLDTEKHDPEACAARLAEYLLENERDTAA